MRLSCPLLLFALLMFAACGDEPGVVSGGNPQGAKKGNDSAQGTPGAFYARYSGMAGNRQIVLNIVQYKDHRSASYYQLSDKHPIPLIPFDTADAGGGFYFKEGRSGERLWHLQEGNDRKLTGKITGASSPGGAVALAVEYPSGSYPLTAYYHQGAGRLLEQFAFPQATAEYGMLWPADGSGWKEDQAAFVRSRISLNMKFEGGGGVANGLKTRATRYFAGYRNELRSVVDSNWPESRRKDVAYNYSSVFYHDVLYNNDNWLIIKCLTGTYTGGAHGMYSSTFLNMDLETSRDWRLEDVVADTAALKPHLALAARDYFGIASTEDLSSRLLVAEVPPTANYYLTPGGLTFVYNPYDIASYADGEVQLFVPFSKLTDLLKPAFKQRMNFSAGSGTAQHIYPVRKAAHGATNRL